MNRSISSNLIHEVGRAVEENLPDGKQTRLILGVSGGPDSMTLLYLFSRLEMDVTAVHCNYQIRGRAADRDQQLVEETASMWGFDAVSLRLDPAEAEGENFQNWARIRRYQIFRDLKDEVGAKGIGTAHHQDDQLETIIQKILRGAGMTAWQGMDVWNGELFRPLLGISKAELLRFASENHVPYHLDGSNEESTYARNFLRNGWFPVMDDLFPGWRENLLKIPDRAREYESLTLSLLSYLKDDDGEILRERLLTLPPDVQKTLVLQILKEKDPSVRVGGGALEQLEQLPDLQTGRQLGITERWSLMRDREQLRFVDLRASREGLAEILLSRKEAEAGSEVGEVSMSLEEWGGKPDTAVLQMDADRIEWPVRLRRWREGDRLNPLGMKGSQTVSDHLTNEKIPALRKHEALLIESFDESICAVIFPELSPGGKPGTIADWARCDEKTDTVLRIRLNG